MTEFKFRCLMCGTCCHEVPQVDDEPTYKRIPLYPEELIRLEKLAEERGIELRTIEDVVFPDVKNKRILVLTYRILLDNEEKVCPFHDPKVGCTIQELKPLACYAYPLAVKTLDAFNMEIQIDPLCKFTIENYTNLKGIDGNSIKIIYDTEYNRAKRMLVRNKKAIFNIKILEKEGKIHIPDKIDISDFNRYLKEWDRTELQSLDTDDIV
jgi:Fe-S-cluster containining protein